MSFALNKVIDGESQTFSNRKILELLGDPINDEIRLNGEVYRISSYISLISGTGGTYIWQEIILSVSENAQTIIPLNENLGESPNLQLVINGVCYEHGISNIYHISENQLYWHGDFPLEITDNIRLKYLKAIQ